MTSTLPSQRRPFASLTHATQHNQPKPGDALKSAPTAAGKTGSALARLQKSVTRPATAATSTAVKKTAAAPISSISSLIQQDKARSKQSSRPATASRLPVGLLATPSLAAALATKTVNDPAWSARQERGFVEWINCQLVGQAHPNSAQSEPITPDALYSRHRALTLQLYHSPAVQAVLSKLDGEIDLGRLTLKGSSSQLAEDYGNRTELIEMLSSSLTNHWLKLTSETISGFEVPKPRSPELVLRFLQEVLFESADNRILPPPVEQQPSSEGTGSMDAEHRQKWEQSRLQQRAKDTLKKVFRLLLLADQAKIANIGGGRGTAASAAGPPLFKHTSSFHSTSDLLSGFSARFLNEGDCLRHLGFLGFKLAHTDRPEDVIDFSVRNLATDLRDGIRLGKLAEMLVGGKDQAAASSGPLKKGGIALHQPLDLVSQMRIPADTESKKLFNLNLALTTLQNHIPSCSSSVAAASSHRSSAMIITAEDLYCGNQVKTYNFLWELILKYDVQNLISTGELQVEIGRIRRQHASFGRGLNAALCKQQENLYFGPSEKVQVLLNWVQTVIWGQSMSALASGLASKQLLIENFTTSFRSGVAACLLLHYYYPTLLPLDQIQHPTQRLDKVAWEVEDCHDAHVEDAENVDPAAESDDAAWVGSFSCKTVFAQPHLRDQPDFVSARRNFALLQRCLQQLGGEGQGVLSVESLFKSGTTDTPDEKATITFLSYMCSRLLILAEEIHAAKTIQRAARTFIVQARARRVLQAAEAAEALQAKQARLKAEALARVAQAAEEAKRQQEAQALLAAKKAERLAVEAERERVENEVRAQAALQARQARLEAQRREWELLQAAELAAEQEAAQVEADRLRAIEEAELATQHAAEQARLEAEAFELAQAQAAEEARMLELERSRRIEELTYVSTMFSTYFRGKMARRTADGLRAERFELHSAAATAIQCAYRGFVARGVRAQPALARDERIWAHQNFAATAIQCAYRCHAARDIRWRLVHERAILLETQRQAAIRIQCLVRSRQSRAIVSHLRYCEQGRQASIALQRFAAATTIQCAIRTRQAKLQLQTLYFERTQLWHSAAIRIQCLVRAHQARAILSQLQSREQERQAAIADQRCFAATTIQCAFRCFQAKSVLRGLVAQKQAELETLSIRTKSAILIQTNIRAHLARQIAFGLAESRRMRLEAQAALEWSSAVRIQCAVRQASARQVIATLRAEKHAQDQLTKLRNHAATIIQCATRARQAKMQLGALYVQRAQLWHQAATRIQCLARSRQSRALLSHLRYCEHERQVSVAHQRFAAATTIQCAVRSRQAKLQLQALLFQRTQLCYSAAIRIQCLVRAHQARGILSRLQCFEQQRQAAITLQCNTAATTIQCAFRCFQAKSILRGLIAQKQAELETLRIQTESAIIIQTYIRSYLARQIAFGLAESKRIRMEEQAALEWNCAIRIQCAVRQANARQVLATLSAEKRAQDQLISRRHHAATIIQCAVRAFIARRELAARMAEIALERARVAARRAAIDAMQAEVRALEARAAALAARDAEERHRRLQIARAGAAVKLQSIFRGKVARRHFEVLRVEAEEARLAALSDDEKWLNAALAASQVFARNRAARRIAETWRQYVASPVYQAKLLARVNAAATVLQAQARGFLTRRFAVRWSAAIITIQKCFRGRCLRRSIGAKVQKRMKEISANLRAAAASVTEEKRVGHRTKSALEVLLSSTNLSTVLHATQTLDRTTGLLGVCCRDALAQNAVPALLEVTRSLNRSKPHLLLLESTLNILLNLASERSTRSAVFGTAQAQLIDTLVDGMQAYSSAPSILLKLARFLAMGVACDDTLRRVVAGNALAMKRLTGLHSLLERKLVLETKSATASSLKRGGMALPAPSASSASAKRSLLSKKPIVATNFDQFVCACHGIIPSVAATPAEKLTSLTACSHHLAELVQSIHA